MWSGLNPFLLSTSCAPDRKGGVFWRGLVFRGILPTMNGPVHSKFGAQAKSAEGSKTARSVGRFRRMDWVQLWNTCYPVRYLLGRLNEVHPSETPHELVFPEFLPTSDTRHGLDFYRELTDILWAEIKKSGIARPEPTPPTKKLAQSTWSEPVLPDERLAFGLQKHRIRARIGFPYFLSGDNTWACSFQLEGLDGSPIQRARGENGLVALAKVTKVIRELFDELEFNPSAAHIAR